MVTGRTAFFSTGKGEAGEHETHLTETDGEDGAGVGVKLSQRANIAKSQIEDARTPFCFTVNTSFTASAERVSPWY